MDVMTIPLQTLLHASGDQGFRGFVLVPRASVVPGGAQGSGAWCLYYI